MADPLILDPEWRPIPGYEGLYSASSNGDIRRDGSTRNLKPAYSTKGYLRVTLCKQGKQKTRLVHHLVLEAFVGPRESGQLTRHMNGVPDDNRIENLAHGTGSENQIDSVKHDTHSQSRKNRCARGHEYTGQTLGTNKQRWCHECKREDAVRKRAKARAKREELKA